MNASKETAREALECLLDCRGGAEEMDFIKEFLEAAERKLPSEAAYQRDKTAKTLFKKLVKRRKEVARANS